MGVKLALLLLLCPLATWAADVSFKLDAANSTIQFQLRAVGFISIGGSAPAQGTIKTQNEKAEIDVSVALATLTMSRDSYREWALSDEFFDADAHPELRFHAIMLPLKRLQQGGVIKGELRVRGVTRTVRFDLAASDCAFTDKPCRVQAHGELSRREFGMKSRRFTLGDRIGVALDLNMLPMP